jgi:hypothetical protein
LTQWLPGAWVLDLVLAGLVAEWLALWWLHRTRGLGPAPGDLAAGLAAGLALMLALRLNVSDPLDGPTVLLLASSGVLHLLDMARRWPRAARMRQEALAE